MRDEISVAGIYSTREDMLKAEVERWTGADSHKMLQVNNRNTDFI